MTTGEKGGGQRQPLGEGGFESGPQGFAGGGGGKGTTPHYHSIYQGPLLDPHQAYREALQLLLWQGEGLRETPEPPVPPHSDTQVLAHRAPGFCSPSPAQQLGEAPLSQPPGVAPPASPITTVTHMLRMAPYPHGLGARGLGGVSGRPSQPLRPLQRCWDGGSWYPRLPASGD